MTTETTPLITQKVPIQGMILDRAEPYRRERPTMTTFPKVAIVSDYSTGGLRIDLALAHLSESLPNGQLRRTELAMKDLRQGVDELSVWLRSAGYDI